MNIDVEKMEKQEMNLPYEQPSLKKYGTMKEFTLGASGSNGDATRGGNTAEDSNVPGDTVHMDGNTVQNLNDGFSNFGGNPDDHELQVNGNED